MQNFAPADIVIYVKDKGITLKEKSLIAFYEDKKIAAIGNECENAQNAGNILNGRPVTVMSPFKQGKIEDYFWAEKMMQFFVHKALDKKKTFFKAEIGVCVSEDLTLIEKKALEDLIYSLRAKHCTFFTVPIDKVLMDLKPEEKKKFDIIIGIEKDNLIEYFQEKLKDVLNYAKKNNISKETVGELIEKQY